MFYQPCWNVPALPSLQWCTHAAPDLLRNLLSPGKLKDLGNSVLGKFGMSLDNFKATKDPSTGAYSINFGQ